MPLMEINVIPLGTKNASVSKYVASAIDVLRKEKRIHYEITAMGTIVEAPSVRHLLRIAEKMHKCVFVKGVRRVVTTIKIDDRRDKRISIKGKVSSVEGKLAS